MTTFTEMAEKYGSRYQAKLAKFVEPLRSLLGINYFFYLYISSGRRCSFVASNTELAQDYVDQKMHFYNPFFTQSSEVASGLYLYDAVKHGKFQNSMEYLEEKYNTKHSCLYTRKERDGTCVYGFSVPKQSIERQNLLINQMPRLMQFTTYFESEMGNSLLAMQDDAIDLNAIFHPGIEKIRIPDVQVDPAQMLQFLTLLYGKENLLANYNITERERECIQLFLCGKTAQEIAKALFLSRRTIEHRLESIKNKLNCRTKSELFSRLQKMQDLV